MTPSGADSSSGWGKLLNPPDDDLPAPPRNEDSLAFPLLVQKFDPARLMNDQAKSFCPSPIERPFCTIG